MSLTQPVSQPTKCHSRFESPVSSLVSASPTRTNEVQLKLLEVV